MLRPDDIAFERTGSGPPMILVHGVPATHSLWRPLVGELARHRTLYAIDLPGFGASRAPEDPRDLELPRLARAILDFAALHRLARFDLVGHSFGGAISAAVAAEAPERVTSLSMIAPMGHEIPPAARLARTSIARRLVAPAWALVPGIARRALVRSSSKVNYGPAHDADRSREIAAELDRSDALRAICALVGAFDYAEYRRRLERLGRELDVPTLLVGAGRDRVVPIRHFESVCTLLPRADREVFADGVHVVMWQHAEPIAQSIVRLAGRSASIHQSAAAR